VISCQSSCEVSASTVFGQQEWHPAYKNSRGDPAQDKAATEKKNGQTERCVRAGSTHILTPEGLLSDLRDLSN